MNIKLSLVEKKDLPEFKKDMQEAFRLGALEGGYDFDISEEILPEADIEKSLNTKGAAAYKAVDEYGNILGGAIIVIDEKTQINHLDFLYVKKGEQNKGVGKFIWSTIENLYPMTKIWETVTPYFEKRNIHFYVNVCHFHIVEFFGAFNKADDEMFRFQKKMEY